MSHLSICYYHQDLHWSLFHSGSRHQKLRHKPHALLLIRQNFALVLMVEYKFKPA